MKKILLIMFCMILLTGSVSSELFTFDNIKIYDEKTQTVTIVNTFGLGSDIATIQLLTPRIHYVPDGDEVFVIEYNITGRSDLDEKFFGITKTYDKEKFDEGEEIELNKNFIWKYVENYQEEVPVYNYEYTTFENGTVKIVKIQNGFKLIDKEREILYDPKIKEIKEDESLIIRGYTDIHQGDNIEFIPNFAGKKITEWATIVSTNGAETIDGDYTVITFTSNGYFNITGDDLDVSVLIVAGGGGGGSNDNTGNAGGGGAGAFFYDSSRIISAGDYVVTVGTGGSAGTDEYGGNGTNSIFDGVTRLGGGGGGYGHPIHYNGSDGGSGGGGGQDIAFGGAGTTGGNDGGDGAGAAGGGGGGAGAVGGNAIQDVGGVGGAGLSSIIYNGTTLWYAGGGGGGAATAGEGGVGGGGKGAYSNSVAATAGIANTGGGGGGGQNTMVAGAGGSGIVIIRYSTYLIPTVTLISPIDNYNSTSQTINFLGNISIVTPTNVSLIVDDVYEQLNTTGILGDYSFVEILSEGEHTWTYESCSAERCANATARTLNIDVTIPAVEILYPTTIIDYHTVNTNIFFNWSANDTHLDTCIYEYESSNTTVTCSDNTTEINITNTENRTIIFYVNDTFGNMNSTTRSWNYKVFENSRTLNTTSYQTQSETFSINITANNSLTAVTLDYNGTDYSTTKSGVVYSSTIDIPLSLGNNSVRWKFTYFGGTIYSDYSYQNITKIVFTYCNATYTVPFLNVSFKDEADNSYINATIPTSNFIYYLGDGTVTKTYTYINATENYYYNFCATPNLTIHADPYIQYKQGADYPQRIYDAEVIDYTNTTTNLTLYLLGTTDGIYVTFQVINTANLVLSGVEVKAIREISGTDVTVGIGTTGADGGVTLWLNPDFSHDFTFTKSGFDVLETSFAPTQSAYTITLSGGVTPTDSYLKGIIRSILPLDSSLVNDTDYTFGFNLTSSFWSLEEYGFDLRLVNGTIITGGSTSTSGTPLTKIYNTNNQTKIYLDYYWLINETYTNGTSLWLVYNTLNTQWSISTFFTDFTTYLDSGFFGIDDFGRYLIIFIFIFFTIGIMSYKFGFTSPLNISVMTFLIVFFFDVVIELIPPISLVSGTEVKYLLTFLTGLIATIVIINEVRK